MQHTHLYIRPVRNEAPKYFQLQYIRILVSIEQAEAHNLLQKSGLIGLGKGSLTETTAASVGQIICKIIGYVRHVVTKPESGFSA